MRKVELRKEKVLLLLADRERLTVSEISNRFEISPATARRLCNQLAEEEKVFRSHGAISKLEPPNDHYDFKKAIDDGYCEKNRIARYAAALPQNGDYLFFETGSTVLRCAAAIADRIRSGKLKNLHVFTNFLLILDLLGTLCEVSLLGGIYHPSKKCVYGRLSEPFIRKMNFDYCFVSCEGISLGDGLMTYDPEAIHYYDLFSHSRCVVVMAHSTKFSQRSLVSYAPCTFARMIITDDGLPEKKAQSFLQQGIDLVRV